jgi:hypothetical protein
MIPQNSCDCENRKRRYYGILYPFRCFELCGIRYYLLLLFLLYLSKSNTSEILVYTISKYSEENNGGKIVMQTKMTRTSDMSLDKKKATLKAWAKLCYQKGMIDMQRYRLMEIYFDKLKA